MGRVHLRDRLFLRVGSDLYRARGLPTLSQSMAADPVAALDDAALPRSLAGRRQSLPHAAARRCRRQSRPAHCRGHQHVHRSHADDQRRVAQRDRDAGLLRGDPVDALRGRPAPSVRCELDHSRLPGVGGAALCRGRNHAHPSYRLAARLAQFPPAAVRGRLPFQPRSGARELRANRAAGRRNRRAGAVARSLRLCRRQLSPDHAAYQEADLSDLRLHADIDRLSLHRDQSRLFCRSGSARRTDADRVRVHQRTDRAVVFRQRLSFARGVAGGDRAP